MARDSGPPVLRQPAALPAEPRSEPRAWAWLGAAGPWPALLVAVLAALLAWLCYGRSDGRDEEPGAAPRAKDKAAAAAEVRLGSGEQALLEATVGSSQKAGEKVAAGPRKELNHVQSDGVAGEPLEMEQLLPKQGVSDSREHPADPHGNQTGEPRPQVGQAGDRWCVMGLAGVPDNVCKDRGEEPLAQPAESRDLDHEEWEVVSEHLAWGEAGKNDGVEDSDSKEWEQGDCPDGDLKAKRVAAVPPMFQNIHVTFRVHYLTHSDTQWIGVTGDHECLGQWHSYVPLKYDKDGFWSESIALPVDTKVEWKFILVENGKVTRWEECGNRTLEIEHEDQMVHRWWGYH